MKRNHEPVESDHQGERHRSSRARTLDIESEDARLGTAQRGGQLLLRFDRYVALDAAHRVPQPNEYVVVYCCPHDEGYIILSDVDDAVKHAFLSTGDDCHVYACRESVWVWEGVTLGMVQVQWAAGAKRRMGGGGGS